VRWPKRASLRLRTVTKRSSAAAEEATDLLKSAYTTATNGTEDYNRKVIEIARTNAHAAFDYGL
jgi:hypothetical protein